MKPKLMGLIGFLLPALCFGQGKHDWNQVLVTPPDSQYTAGNQILHFKSKNKHYSLSNGANQFIQEHLQNALPLESDADVLRVASDHVEIEGTYLEMGICTGKTINLLVHLTPCKRSMDLILLKGYLQIGSEMIKFFPKKRFRF